jgi:hypothetical protein
MPIYQFDAMDATGQEIKDEEIEAISEEEAQAHIRQMGYFVTKIALKRKSRAARVTGPYKKSSPDDEFLAIDEMAKGDLPDSWTSTIPHEYGFRFAIFIGGFVIGWFLALAMCAS